MSRAVCLRRRCSGALNHTQCGMVECFTSMPPQPGSLTEPLLCTPPCTAAAGLIYNARLAPIGGGGQALTLASSIQVRSGQRLYGAGPSVLAQRCGISHAAIAWLWV